jgi:bacterioferritin (cytochrome b1)
MEKLAQYNRGKVIDLLTERLVFERSAVKLYDSIVEQIERSGEIAYAPLVDQLREHGAEEKAHEEWLEAQVRALGGDAHGQTEMSRLVQTESLGIEKVVLAADGSIPHLLHALLAAELVDNAGWDMLVELADDAGDRMTKRELKQRLHEEEEHLRFVQRALERMARQEVLGEQVTMPSQP